MIKKILIANRGEIAIRVMRACREMGIPSVAVFSEADKDALFARYADEAYWIGPAPATQSYLNIPKIIETARECGADAIHPGYGFLAENPEFAAACETEGIRFIGPSSRVLRLLGDKVAARREMMKAGIPVVPGTDECVENFEHARSAAGAIGYPVIIKPSGGGGGIGMTIVGNEKRAGEGAGIRAGDRQNDLRPRRCLHRKISVQSAPHRVSDSGRFRRECHPSGRTGMLHPAKASKADRGISVHGAHSGAARRMGAMAVNAARCVGYEGAGTVEFLFSNGRFYFLEVNARVQVEHPVTEMVTGIDIVKEQIRIASGLPLRYRQEDVRISGSAIECRINAEDPLNGFVPAPGKIHDLSSSRRHRNPRGQRSLQLLHHPAFLRSDDIEADRLGQGPG